MLEGWKKAGVGRLEGGILRTPRLKCVKETEVEGLAMIE